MKPDFRRMWHILLIVALLTFIVGWATDASDVDRYCQRMECLLSRADYEKALHVGEQADATNERLTALRVYALAHEHQLGEHLFRYPLTQGDWTFPNGFRPDSHDPDLRLSRMLVNRRLDDFARELPRHYTVMPDSLPRHYREALVLYNRLHARPLYEYHDDVMDTDYADLLALERQYSDPKERRLKVFEQYRNTYWYYYDQTK